MKPERGRRRNIKSEQMHIRRAQNRLKVRAGEKPEFGLAGRENRIATGKNIVHTARMHHHHSTLPQAGDEAGEQRREITAAPEIIGAGKTRVHPEASLASLTGKAPRQKRNEATLCVETDPGAR